MDQAARQDSEAVGTVHAPEADESQLREDIAQRRGDLGDTVAALVEKTDVKTRAKEKVQGIKQTAVRKKNELAGDAQGASPDGAGVGAQRLVVFVRDNPAPAYATGALVIGYLLGRRGRRT